MECSQLLFDECYSDTNTYLGDNFINLMPGNTVLDVGANIGLFSLFASRVGCCALSKMMESTDRRDAKLNTARAILRRLCAT